MTPRDRTSAGDHVLLVGDSHDLGTIREILSRLPDNAYGQVFLEVAASFQVQNWTVPEGVVVSWLCRDARVQDYGILPARGELASRAVEAWVREWMPDDASDAAAAMLDAGWVGDLDYADAWPYVMWIGCATSPIVDRVYRDLTVRFEGLHLHHPHDADAEHGRNGARR